jgi:hypothetical protein
MTDLTDQRRGCQFRFGTILLWMVIVAMGVGWWVDHRQHEAELIEQRRETVRSIIEENVDRLRSRLVGVSQKEEVFRIVDEEWPLLFGEELTFLSGAGSGARFDGDRPIYHYWSGYAYGELVTIIIWYDRQPRPAVDEVELWYGPLYRPRTDEESDQ